MLKDVSTLKSMGLREIRTGQFYPLGEYTILGKDAELPIPVESNPNTDSVEERHLRIEKHPEGYLIKDLRSRHGTFVNQTRINEAWLSSGDEIQLGESLFMLEDPEETKEIPPLQSKNIEWNNQLQRLPSIARSTSPVLLLGPSGSGKEVLAQTIHKSSLRSFGPMVEVNCSALTDSLIESELFGHVKGSFTGALNDRKGAFEVARGGTLFLDEIGDLPLNLQAKLLRALENFEIRPVGSDRTIKTNVRIIAATHQNLIEKIARGEFRLDLYYRLAVSTIRTPALCERLEDFDEILMSFARKMKVRFSFNAIQKLKNSPWPGNIRELRNSVSRAAAYFPKQLITEEMLTDIIDPLALSEFKNMKTEEPPDANVNIGPIIKEIEKEMILKRLQANRGNQRKTAEDLRMPKSTLNDRLKTYGIDPKIFG